MVNMERRETVITLRPSRKGDTTVLWASLVHRRVLAVIVSRFFAEKARFTNVAPEFRQSVVVTSAAVESQMAVTLTWCPVLGAHIPRVTDVEGKPGRIVCVECEEPSGTCSLKKVALRAALEGGPLAQRLERMSEDALNTRSTLCLLRAT